MIYQLEPHVAETLKAFFDRFDFIDKVVIFGSRGRHDANPKSDIDLCVYSLEMTPGQFSRLKLELDELPILYKMDIVHFEKSNDALKANVERDGKLLFVKKAPLEELEKQQLITVSKGKQLPKEYKNNGEIQVIGAGRTSPYSSSHANHDNATITISSSGAYAGYVWSHDYPIWASDCTIVKAEKGIDQNYLFFFLLSKQEYLYSLQSGAGQPHVYWRDIKKIEISLPSLTKQKAVAATLERAKALIDLRRESLKKLDELVKSVFVEMFGDPYINENQYVEKTMSQIGCVQTGNTPPRKEVDNYGDFIEWIKTDNIDKEEYYLSKAKEYLSEKGYSKGRTTPANSLLFACIAGSMSSIGNLAISTKEVAFNQQINALEPEEDNVKYLYFLFKLMKKYFEENSTKSMKIMISKSTFEDLSFPIAPVVLQNQFASIIEKIETQKALYQEELKKLEENFDALLARSFEG